MVGLHPFVDLIDFLCNKGGQVCLHGQFVSMGLLIVLVCNKLKKCGVVCLHVWFVSMKL